MVKDLALAAPNQRHNDQQNQVDNYELQNCQKWEYS